MERTFGPLEDVLQYLVLTYVEMEPSLIRSGEIRWTDRYMGRFGEWPPMCSVIPGILGRNSLNCKMMENSFKWAMRSNLLMQDNGFSRNHRFKPFLGILKVLDITGPILQSAFELNLDVLNSNLHPFMHLV